MPNTHRRGFSMIESVIASALLGLMAFFGLSLSVMSLKGVDHARNQSQAKAVAQTALTEWSRRAFESGPGPREVVEQELNGVVYQRTVRVLLVDGFDPLRLRRLEVLVKWNWRGQEQELVRAKWVRHAE